VTEETAYAILDFPAIKGPQQELSQFLEEHPELIAMQADIERGLGQIDDPIQRLERLTSMMMASQAAMKREVSNLQAKFDKTLLHSMANFITTKFS
jgi:hypothetical protein